MVIDPQSSILFEQEYGHGETTLALTEVDDGTHRTLTTIWHLPAAIRDEHAPFAVCQSHDRAPDGPLDPSETQRITQFVKPGDYDHLPQAKEEHPFLEYLGYSHFSEVANTKPGYKKITEALTYPTTDTLNGFMDRVFGSDGSVRFETFPGGEFSARGFVEALAERGAILAADELPLSAHDLADHAIGWIGIDPQAVKALRLGSVACLERIKNPRLTRNSANQDIFSQVAESADEISGSIARYALYGGGSAAQFEMNGGYASLDEFCPVVFRRALASAGLSYGSLSKIELAAVGRPEDLSQTTIARFKRANDFARQQLAKEALEGSATK